MTPILTLTYVVDTTGKVGLLVCPLDIFRGQGFHQEGTPADNHDPMKELQVHCQVNSQVKEKEIHQDYSSQSTRVKPNKERGSGLYYQRGMRKKLEWAHVAKEDLWIQHFSKVILMMDDKIHGSAVPPCLPQEFDGHTRPELKTHLYLNETNRPLHNIHTT